MKTTATAGLFAIDDLAGYLNVSRSTVLNLEKQNRLPSHVQIGHRRFWKRETIDNWLTTTNQ